MVGFERISTKRTEKVRVTELGPEERRLVLEWKLGLRSENHSLLCRGYSHSGIIIIQLAFTFPLLQDEFSPVSICCVPSYAKIKFPVGSTSLASIILSIISTLFIIPKFSPIIFPFA